MEKIILFFPFAFVFAMHFLHPVRAGCADLRLCCPGRNMTCLALDTGVRRPPGPTAQPGGGSRERPWHFHYDKNTKFVDSNSIFGLGLGEDRLFEGLLSEGSSLNRAEQADPKRSANVRLTEESLKNDYEYVYDEKEEKMIKIFKSTSDGFSATMAPGASRAKNESDAENFASGAGAENEEYDNVEWVNSKEKTSTESKDDETKIATGFLDEKDRYQTLRDKQSTKERKDYQGDEGEHLMIKYVIENDDVPVSLEHLMVLQNYRSISGGDHKICYCDEACRRLGDCCGDYEYVCPVYDCLAGEWSDWSPCEVTRMTSSDAECGFGVSRRRRTVVRAAAHGGLACPVLEQQRACFSTESDICRQIHMSEVALLLPYEYAPARVPGFQNGSHIFYDSPLTPTQFDATKNYCVTFEVTWMNPACSDKTAKSALAVGQRVCMECQQVAQVPNSSRCVGQGAEGQQTAFSLINAKHCSGFWTPLNRRTEICSCERDFSNEHRYLFV